MTTAQLLVPPFTAAVAPPAPPWPPVADVLDDELDDDADDEVDEEEDAAVVVDELDDDDEVEVEVDDVLAPPTPVLAEALTTAVAPTGFTAPAQVSPAAWSHWSVSHSKSYWHASPACLRVMWRKKRPAGVR